MPTYLIPCHVWRLSGWIRVGWSFTPTYEIETMDDGAKKCMQAMKWTLISWNSTRCEADRRLFLFRLFHFKRPHCNVQYVLWVYACEGEAMKVAMIVRWKMIWMLNHVIFSNQIWTRTKRSPTFLSFIPFRWEHTPVPTIIDTPHPVSHFALHSLLIAAWLHNIASEPRNIKWLGSIISCHPPCLLSLLSLFCEQQH